MAAPPLLVGWGARFVFQSLFCWIGNGGGQNPPDEVPF